MVYCTVSLIFPIQKPAQEAACLGTILTNGFHKVGIFGTVCLPRKTHWNPCQRRGLDMSLGHTQVFLPLLHADSSSDRRTSGCLVPFWNFWCRSTGDVPNPQRLASGPSLTSSKHLMDRIGQRLERRRQIRHCGAAILQLRPTGGRSYALVEGPTTKAMSVTSR
jgi:hypothetical protein